FEHGFDQGEAVRSILGEADFDSVRTIRDLGGNERCTLGRIST
ncbi:MAG TPA: protein-(glutamine-N5) methyltransferase, release factor-specific, partial [Sutterella sp.]|nr:protein-(glutamine-N5) methyltransferase, release factor-specific [Sutterella sp.]